MFKYKRILLKLSGEALAGNKEFGFSEDVLESFAKQIKDLHSKCIEIAIVIGGGNIFRGTTGTKKGVDRVTGDTMGMLATIMNGLALQDAIERLGVPTRVLSALQMPQVAEPFIRRKAIRHLEKGRVIIFAGGTGNPYFTTDTAAALRAAEIGADAILVGKTIDGVYSDDPKINPNAVKFDEITYMDVLNKDLKVMDSTAISLCKDNNIPLIVFAIDEPENMIKAIKGEKVGTFVGNKN